MLTYSRYLSEFTGDDDMEEFPWPCMDNQLSDPGKQLTLVSYIDRNTSRKGDTSTSQAHVPAEESSCFLLLVQVPSYIDNAGSSDQLQEQPSTNATTE